MTLKETLKIVVTDSGVGGLAFCAELAEYLKKTAYSSRFELIFFNCLPSQELGYQDLKTDMERTAVFSNALNAINRKYSPDMIIIACNTLSAVYSDTEFSRDTQIIVKGIIEPGVLSASRLLKSDNDLALLMLGTPVTVKSGLHRQQLVDSGISNDRLFYSGCSGLPRLISHSRIEAEKAVDLLLDEAACQLEGKKFGLALFCTHFSYIRDYFYEAASRYPGFSGDIVEPNQVLLEIISSDFKFSGHCSNEIDIKVVSKVRLNSQVENSIVPLIRKISPETAHAFSRTIHLPKLFDCCLTG